MIAPLAPIHLCRRCLDDHRSALVRPELAPVCRDRAELGALRVTYIVTWPSCRRAPRLRSLAHTLLALLDPRPRCPLFP